MAAKSTAAGSAAWISAEKENVLQLLQQEKEELVYPAQHEMEWLNEHMAEIFSKSHIDITNVFKTPGKMKGKTPRTNRKRNIAETRIPLSDVFSSQPARQQSPIKSQFSKPPPRFEIAQDAPQPQKVDRSQTDSGYHGSSQVQMEAEPAPPSPPPRSPLRTQQATTGAQSNQSRPRPTSQERRTTEGSFHSAKEDQTTKVVAPQPQGEEPEQTRSDPEPARTQVSSQPQGDLNMDDIGSPSDESTPDRHLVRKGSFTFASLPARQSVKTSLGNRTSRTSHLDPKKSLGQMRTSHSLHRTPAIAADEDSEEDEEEDTTMENSHIEILGHSDSEDESQVVKQYSKSTTQRLHDRIEMLGKAPPPRTSKSIPSAMQIQNRQSNAPPQNEMAASRNAEDDDDWIKPLSSPQLKQAGQQQTDENYEVEESDDDVDLRAPELIAHEERTRTPTVSPSPARKRPGFGHAKSASTATLVSPAKNEMAPPASPAKSISVSNPAQATTTPKGSPRRYLDLSASKSKLQSIMKTAKGLFTSSAGVSAAAKLETLSPSLREACNAMPGMYPSIGMSLEDKPLPASPPREARKTRSSSEREREEKRKEKDAKVMQKMDDQLEKAREKEAHKAAQQKEKTASPAKPTDKESDQQPSFHQQTTKPNRPGRPGTQPVNKAKPAPVSIRVGTLSSRMPMNSSIATSNQETLPAEPKRPGITKKASNSSIQSTTSTTNFKTSVHAQPTKPKALLAAERKREQDEKEAQRKLEQKREMERKRTAQQEEARKQEARQRAEADKKERERLAAEQAKRQAQQQAIERKRQENARKVEQQKLERERAAAESANAARPPSRLGNQPAPRSLINHPLPTNPAKPPKRPLEEESGRAQASKFGAASQQQDAKRRRTEDEQEQAPRPTMSGAPIRQSNLGKKPSIFNHSTYAAAPQPSHFPQPPSRAQPPQMVQYANSKIPFADAPNPPQNKTPVSAYQIKTIQAVKSSPQLPHGEKIELPEIPTDSEDEDSEDEGNAFPIPDWATPGHLTDQLIRQEAMDGDAVFGPIAPLKMEEIFAKGNKDRLKKLRDRTSSANWAISGDGLTLEEVRADREQRERMRLEGGWRYGN